MTNLWNLIENFSVPACSNSVSRTDSSWGWGGSSNYNQEEPRQDYNRDYPVSNNNFESDFGSDSRWEDSNQNSNRGVRPGAGIHGPEPTGTGLSGSVRS